MSESKKEFSNDFELFNGALTDEFRLMIEQPNSGKEYAVELQKLAQYFSYIPLIAISNDQPSQNHELGDKYYNTGTKKIYSFIDYAWTDPQDAEIARHYIYNDNVYIMIENQLTSLSDVNPKSSSKELTGAALDTFMNRKLILDGNGIINQGYISNTGVESINNDYCFTDYIEYLPFKDIICKNFHGSENVRKIDYYDAKKQSISFVTNSGDSFLSTSPSGTCYARFCYKKYESSNLLTLATVESKGLIVDNKIVGAYAPLSQQADNHLMTISRNLPWKYSAYRSPVHISDILTNIIEMPFWSYGAESSFKEFRLLIADDSSVLNPSLMLDLTEQILTFRASTKENTSSILTLKNPIKIEVGKIVVFAWESNLDYMIFGNTNPDTSTLNKLSFLFSGTGAWDVNWSISSGVDNLTPAFVFSLDDNYTKLNDNWKPRGSKIIARNGQFVKDTQTSLLAGGYSISRLANRSINLRLGVDSYIERCRLDVALSVGDIGTSGYVGIGKYVAGSTGYTEMRITKTALELRLIGGDYESIQLSIPLGDISVVTGTELTLSYIKDADGCTYTVNNGTSYISKRVEKYNQADIANEELLSMMWGDPYFSTYDCNCFVKNIAFSSEYEVDAVLSIFGDSFIEGSSLAPEGLGLRYAAKIANEVGIDNVAIFGKGGEKLSPSWMEAFHVENDWYRSKYLLIALGTNNSDFVTYKAILQGVISTAKQNSQIPVLVTVTPTPTNATFQTQANAWVRNSGEIYVDVCKAVTITGNERVWKSGFVFSDDVHPTASGHQAIYDRVKLDAPEILLVEQGIQGEPGFNGWTPATEFETYGNKQLKKLTGYIGGTGTAPTDNMGLYFTSGGFTADKDLATDFRGTDGENGETILNVNPSSAVSSAKVWIGTRAQFDAQKPLAADVLTFILK